MRKTSWIWTTLALVAFGIQLAAAEALSTAKEQQIISDVLSIYESQSPLLEAGGKPEIRKCGTSIVAEARVFWAQLSAETRALLKPYIQERPERQAYYDVPGIAVRIHYDTTDTHAVDMQHGVDTEGVPMYVRRVAEIMQEVRQKEIVDMGYPVPPADDFYPEGGTAEYDIYLTNLSSAFYGLTHGEEAFYGADEILHMTSYIELDNDYQGYSLYGPDEWDLILAVTAAHEFFHAIQYGIDASEFLENADDTTTDLWWHEMSSTWMEDIVYDEVNDYYYYLDGFFNHPNWALTTQRKVNYEYGACVWPRYLSERFGNDIMYDIWTQCGEKRWLNSIEAWADQIEARGSTLPEELGRFRLWCYFSGDRYRSFAFAEGANYPTFDEIEFVARHNEYPVVDSVSRLAGPQFMGAAYLEFIRPASDTTIDFKIKICHDNFDLWAISAAGLTEQTEPALFFTGSITTPLVVENWLNYERIIVVPMPFNMDYSSYKNLPSQKIVYEVADTLPSDEGNKIKAVRPNPYAVEEDDGLLWIPVNRESKRETEVFFYNVAGELIRGGRNETSEGKTPFYIEEGHGSTAKTFTWDGRNFAGEKVASGIYLCLVRMGGQTSMQKVAVFRK